LYWDAPDSNGAGTGRATITALTDTSVQGNFSFDAISRVNGSRKTVSNGNFRLKLEDRRICKGS
jgi:hypothetical protein